MIYLLLLILNRMIYYYWFLIVFLIGIKNLFITIEFICILRAK